MIIGVVVVAAVGAGAFFVLSNSDDGRRDEYVDALNAGYTSSFAEQDDPILSGLDENEIRCMAETMVDAVGVDRLEENNTPEELQAGLEADPEYELIEGDPNQEEAEEVVDGMEQCFGFFDRMREQVRESYESNPAVSPEITDCVVTAMDDDFLRTAFADDFAETADADDALSTRAEEECGHLAPGA